MTTQTKSQPMQENEIVLYQPNETTRIEVRLDDETVWLTANQMADLFQRDEKTIRKHINNVFADGELLKDINTHFLRLDGVKQPVAFYTLDESSVSSILEHTASDGKTYQTQFYNLDAILSVGYRVNSINASVMIILFVCKYLFKMCPGSSVASTRSHSYLSPINHSWRCLDG